MSSPARQRSVRGTTASEPPAPLPGTARPAGHSPGGRGAGALTLVTFGFKYGPPPANHYFDVSFLKNPAREEGWSLWSTPGEEMRRWVLAQPAAVEFLEAVVPLARFLASADDDARLALGCSAGRHRSAIVAEALAERLSDEGVAVRVHHRERAFARPTHEQGLSLEAALQE